MIKLCSAVKSTEQEEDSQRNVEKNGTGGKTGKVEPLKHCVADFGRVKALIGGHVLVVAGRHLEEEPDSEECPKDRLEHQPHQKSHEHQLLSVH